MSTCNGSWPTCRPSICSARFDNDIEQFGAIEQLPLAQVRCPTLVVHGAHDGDVRFSHGENSARAIAGAEFHRVEQGWHLLALSDGAEETAQAELAFLREQLGA